MTIRVHPKDFTEFQFPVSKTGFGYVYYLFDKEDTIVYVGQSINILNRMAAHIYEEHINFTRCTYRLEKISDLNNIEADEILKYWPRYNRTIPRNSFYFNFECYSRINPILKGKRCKVKKFISSEGIKDRYGYIEVSDWEKICDFLGGV